jgi:hypothetical protein
MSQLEDGRGRRADRGALIWGTLFTLVGLTYLLQELGVWEVRGEVLLPALLIAVGVVVVLTGLTGSRDADEPRGAPTDERRP